MRPSSLAATFAGLCLGLGSGAALADNEAIVNKLTSYESEARALGTDLPRPNQLSNAAGQRRLVDAEVAFSLGDYDTAALVLLDLVGKAQGPDKETATYYLGEALYQKGDRGAAREYFKTLAASSMSRYYQPALQRLVEIAIFQRDTVAGDEAIRTLGSLSPGERLASVPYIRGKYAFSQDKYDDALAAFAEVPKGSDYELQALYYAGTCQVAKNDLAKATEMFADLINRKPRSSNDRRVIELGQLGLGRLYYEREEPSKAIDSYLLIDRHSDLFADALYEVAWVYVKSKQYDKALRALELLAESQPSSNRTPTVRILEGNLRIRKAQLIRTAQINGTTKAGDASDPSTEYDKATELFLQTHDQYLPSYEVLTQLVDGTLDPATFLDQIANRSTHVFQAAAPIPEAAADALRDEPEVQRIVGIENDLGSTQSDIDESEAIIERLEGVLAAGDRRTVYPKLASRRARIASMQDELIKIRNDLAEQQAHGGGGAETATRRQLAQQYAALGDPEQAYIGRVSATQAGFDKIDTDTIEISTAIDSAQAIAIALRKYAVEAKPPLSADLKTNLQQTLDAAATEAQSIEDELAQIHREATLGRDLSGVRDAGITQARELRKQLKAAQDAEHRALGSSPLADRATLLADSLDQTDATIDQVVAQGLSEVTVTLAQERKNLVDLKQELAASEAESRPLGSLVIGASFKTVKAKFYDVVVRTDVGNVDVAWSQKEDTDDDLKRLNLARSRELKQLKDEFKDVLEEAPKPAAQPRKSAIPAPSPEGPGQSPDKATGKPGDGRIKPVDDQGKSTTQPTVKPIEDKKGAPKGTPPKRGGR